jgi:hypothetical protein
MEDRVLNPPFRNAAAFDLKFGVLVVTDHGIEPLINDRPRS